MDLAKAFDTVNHEILLCKLEQYGMRGVANELLQSYLSNHKQLVSGNDISSSLLNIIIGVLQGSVLGPILFLIYVNDLSKCSNLNITLYADDSVLILSHKHVDSLKLNLKNELPKVCRWLTLNKLPVNISNTKYLFFTRSNKNISWKSNGRSVMQKIV